MDRGREKMEVERSGCWEKFGCEIMVARKTKMDAERNELTQDLFCR